MRGSSKVSRYTRSSPPLWSTVAGQQKFFSQNRVLKALGMARLVWYARNKRDPQRPGRKPRPVEVDPIGWTGTGFG